MFCCMRASVSGLMALLVLWFFPLNIFVHSFIIIIFGHTFVFCSVTRTVDLSAYRSTASRSPVLTRGSICVPQSPTCRTAFPSQHLRPSGVLSCYPGPNEQYRHSLRSGEVWRSFIRMGDSKRTYSRDISARFSKGSWRQCATWIYTVRQKKRNEFSFFVCIAFNTWQKLVNLSVYIKERTSYNSVYLILACIKNFT